MKTVFLTLLLLACSTGSQAQQPTVSPTGQANVTSRQEQEPHIEAILKDLRNAHPDLNGKQDILSFKLTHKGLYVNGLRQSEALFRQLEKRHLNRATTEISYSYSTKSTVTRTE